MTFDEYVEWVVSLQQEGSLAPEQVADVIAQRERFDVNRAGIESQYAGWTVGVVADEVIYGRSALAILDAAEENFPGRIMYFESVENRE
jgi:hypothetical protein